MFESNSSLRRALIGNLSNTRPPPLFDLDIHEDAIERQCGSQRVCWSLDHLND